MKKLLAIDGNSIINRAYYGIRPLTNKDGLYTHAVYGMLNIITSQIQQLEPDAVAAAFDLKVPTFRHKMYDGYKANRKGMPEELAVQLPYAKQVLDAMGVSIITVEGYEADDVLGTLAAMSDENMHVYILTGDRDSLQLISDTTSVLLVTTGQTVLYNRDVFFEKYGIEPSEFVDAKALMGDSSDNIPGVPGIGEKTALKLIAQYKSIDGLYNELESAPVGKSAKEKLSAEKDSAYMSQKLARICTDAPIGVGREELFAKDKDDKKLFELFTELEFSAYINKMGLSAKEEDKEQIYFKISDQPDTSGILYSIYFDDKIYLYDGNNGFCCDSVSNRFLSQNKFIVSDSKAAYYINENINAVFDTSLASYVLNSGDGDHTPQRLCSRYFGVTPPEQTIISDGQISNGNTVLCRYLYKLYELFSGRLSDEGTEKLYYETELPLSRVLYSMEKQGFKVDTAGIKDFGAHLNSMLCAIKERIYMQSGEEFNINSPKQLGHVLFEVLGLPAPKKTKTGYSTGADVLEKLRPYSPLVDDILEYRAITKLIGTYVDGMLKVCDENGIIHTSFNQTVTATGRLSSTEPNLQNIPIRTELGRELRRYFISGSDEYTLVDADYSQIELRLLAAISGDEKMIEAFENGTDIHATTASQVFRVPLESVTAEMRKSAKAVNFGIIYGIGAFTLSQDIHVSKKAAEKYIEDYLNTYPAVKDYLENVKKQAKKDGYVKTLFQRRRYIPELASAKKTEQAFGERVAMNSPIQGSAADIIKIAMVNTYRALRNSGLDAHLILQVHDELIIETKKSDKEKVKEILKTEMENAVLLPVQLSVSISDGDTWYKCK